MSKNTTRTALIAAMLVAFVAAPVAAVPAAGQAQESNALFMIAVAACSDCVDACANACIIVESVDCKPTTDGNYQCFCRCRI